MDLPPGDDLALLKAAAALGVTVVAAITAALAKLKSNREPDAPPRLPSPEETAIISATSEARVRAAEAEAARLRLAAEMVNLRQDLSDLLGATRQSVRDMIAPVIQDISQIKSDLKLLLDRRPPRRG